MKKKYQGFIAMIVAMAMIFTYSIAPIRDGVGAALDVVLGPLAGMMPFYVLIIFLSAVTGIYSSIIQKYTIDYEKMQETQAKMRVFQKEFREAQLSGDEKRVKKLQGKQERMMQDQLDMSRQQFTPMAIILILSVPIFFWLLLRLPAVGTPIDIASGIVMPFIGTVTLSSIAFWIVPAWILWYMLCSLTISQVIRKALNIGGL